VAGVRALVGMLVVLAVAPGVARADDRAFSVRFEANDEGSIALAANTLESCPESAACSAIRSGAIAFNNNGLDMRPVNAAGGAVNSSSADLALPAGATVLFAGLYWGADTSAGINGAPAPARAQRNRVRLRVPGAADYQDVVVPLAAPVPGAAGGVDDGTPTRVSGERYQGFADVTGIVRVAGPGTYAVADVQAGTGRDRYAGWSLVVAYRDPAEPARNLTVFDGLQTIEAGSPRTRIPVDGFLTPLSGPVRTTLGIVSYEGDVALTGDTATLDTAPLSDPANPRGNLFNSSVSLRGARFAAKAPDFVNQLGVDADTFAADGVLANGARGAAIDLTTTGDQYLPGVVTFATELFAPDIDPVKTQVNLTRSTGPARPGDLLEYGVRLTNTGQDGATGVTLRDAVPAGTAYVPGSLAATEAGPDASCPTAFAGRTDAADGDPAEHDAATNAVVLRLGAGASGSAGGALAPGQTACARFRVRVGAVASGTRIANTGRIAYAGRTLGTALTGTSNEVSTDVVVPPTTTEPSLQPPGADLVVSKVLTPDDPTTADTVRAVVRVENRGPSPATDLTLVDRANGPLSRGRPRPDAGTCDSGRPVRCHLDELAPGATWTIRIDADPTGPGRVRDTATVRSPTPDATPEDHRATASTRVRLARAGLQVTKRADRRTARSGQLVTFRIAVRATGPGPALGVRTCDALPAAMTFVRAPGARFRAGRACWTTASLAPGEREVHTVVARVAAGLRDARVRNVVVVRGRNVPTRRASAPVRIAARTRTRSGGVTG
jgi:uncharacterized repeat protein (TIGR01451 family)